MKDIIVENIEYKQIIAPEISMRLQTDKSNIKELSDSIDAVGLINPITVKKAGKHYEVVAGFRRYLAIGALKWKQVPSIVLEESSEMAVGIMTAENYEREDVNIFDEAMYLKKLINKTGLTQKALSKAINRSESYVSERVAILVYQPELRDALYSGKISFSVARELNKIKDESERLQYIRYAIENGATPDIARRWRKELEQRNEISSEQIVENAVENYNEATNKTTVMMLCKICNENTDVNNLQTMYVCRTCVDVLRKAAAI
jgi:ParB family chromosome partitioning protein